MSLPSASSSVLLSSSKAVLNPGEDDEMECRGFRANAVKAFFAHMMSMMLAGVPYLLVRWWPGWKMWCFKSRCPLDLADTVLLTNKSAKQSVEKVHRVEAPPDFMDEFSVPECGRTSSDRDHLLERHDHVFFYHDHVKYAWSNVASCFVRLTAFTDQKILSFHSEFSGYSAKCQSTRQLLFGLNSIEVEVKPYLKLLFEEVLNPFYIFQAASMVLWSFDNYFYYASCILVISLLSIVISLLETRRQSQALHDMVAQHEHLIATVSRGDDEFEDVPSKALVPGDLMAIPAHGCVMPCDAVLISGSCIINESMLTGESIPVTKTALPMHSEELYDPEKHARHTVFAGTAVIQTRYYNTSRVLAVATHTGFSTAKGELIRSILFPKPVGFKFYRDSVKFICVLFIVALLGMLYCVYVYVTRRADAVMILLRCLDIITIVVPPALPAAMTVGTYYAQSRLKKNGIFCISPQKINVCGKLKLVCFDKTGTLTEDGMNLWGAVPAENALFLPADHTVWTMPQESPVLNCLAACHSLTLIDGELIGDPLDIKMFESTRWELEEAGTDTSKFDMLMPSVVRPKQSEVTLTSSYVDKDEMPYEVGIIRQFTFSSSLARMSVITRTLGSDHFDVYTKGAPEKLEDLCLAKTLPSDFHERLQEFALRGFRVIALAHKRLGPDNNWVRVQKMKREVVESELTFLGFLVMQNTLKPQTEPVIKELKHANIRCLMVTGDNLLTAISVARDCKMVNEQDRVIIVEAEAPGEDNTLVKVTFTDMESNYLETSEFSSLADLEGGFIQGPLPFHLALNGKTWGILCAHYPSLLPRICVSGTVFARMAPEQKAQLVETLQTLDYVVSMCGDGANDCGALKAAHVGISLSEAEASVAAPFTSRTANITCVPQVIREGRCALVTSFGVFKYMALYSMVQFVSVLLLYTEQTNLGDPQFLYIDLVITTTVAVLMGRTSAAPSLCRKRPPGSLVSGPMLFSIAMQILLVIGVQMAAFFYLSAQPWFIPNRPTDPDIEVVVCWETTTIFSVSSFQYLILAAAFSRGLPFRSPLYTNGPFLTALVTLVAFTTVLALYPGSGLAAFFQLKFDPQMPRLPFHLSLLAFAFIHMVLAFAIEAFVAASTLLKKATHIITNKKEPKNMYKRVEKDIREANWPSSQESLVQFSPGIS